MNKFETLTSLIKQINYLTLTVGEILTEFKDGSYEDYTDTWQQFVKQPEIGMTVGEANKLIDVYVTYVDFLDYTKEYVSEISFRNLKTLLPEATKGYINDEIMEQAKVLSNQDLKDTMIEPTATEEVPRTYTYMVMKKCDQTGNMNKVHGVDSEDVERFVAKETSE